MVSKKVFDYPDQSFDNYQEWVLSTCIHKDTVYPLLGLAGETGEFLELCKKGYRKAGDGWWAAINREDAVSELGDILWYVARISRILGIPLSEVVEYNKKKINDRQKPKQEDLEGLATVS